MSKSSQAAAFLCPSFPSAVTCQELLANDCFIHSLPALHPNRHVIIITVKAKETVSGQCYFFLSCYTDEKLHWPWVFMGQEAGHWPHCTLGKLLGGWLLAITSVSLTVKWDAMLLWKPRDHFGRWQIVTVTSAFNSSANPRQTVVSDTNWFWICLFEFPEHIYAAILEPECVYLPFVSVYHTVVSMRPDNFLKNHSLLPLELRVF